MTDWEVAGANREIARAIERLARAVELKTTSREPVFIFVPSDLKPEDAQRLGRTLADAFKGRI